MLADSGDISLGGITADDARARMNAIIESDRDDDDALRAYDLLQNFVTYGRPW